MHVIVIGAGVVGTTTALALAERGMRVTLLERNASPALETSRANGGGVTPAHAEPWNAPGLLGKLMRELGNADAPYRLSPLAVPGMGLWGIRFLRNMKRERFIENARRNIRLGLYSLDCLRAWRQRYAMDYHQTTQGSMQVFFDTAVMDEAWSFRTRLVDGLIPAERIDGAEAIRREPALEPVRQRLAGAIRFPDHESGDACAFSQAAARLAEEKGASLYFNTDVERIECDRDGFRAVVADGERIEGDACVLAAGPASSRLGRSAGLRLPIYPVRGYSATFELDQIDSAPTLPILDTASRFVTLRLGEKVLRVAGLADFAGHSHDIPMRRIESLLAGARRLLPNLADELVAERAELWSGLRPVTPDGVPLLGPTRVRGLFTNCGHGPMGWTMACGSAEIVADLVAGKSPHESWPRRK